MEHRVGKCTDCQASFKVPATFEADKAKCKKCGGVVEIGPVVSDSPSASAPAAASPKPVPARKPAVRPPAAKAPAPEAKAPAAKAKAKPQGASMKERLMAERQAEAEKASSSAKPAAKGQRGAAPAAHKAGAPPARKAGATSGASRSGARRGAKDGDKASAGEGRRGRRAPVQKPKKSPAPMLVALVLMLVAVFAMWKFVLTDETPAQAATNDQSSAPAATGSDESVALADETSGAQDPTPAAATPESKAPSTSAAGAADEGGAADEESSDLADGAASDEPAKPAKAPKPKVEKEVDVDSVDLSELVDFGAYSESSEEDWREIRRLVVVMLDPDAGAAGRRAGNTLTTDFGKQAIPAILNEMKRLDLSLDQGRKDGDIAQRTLMDICNGRNIGWKYTIEPEDVLFNKKVVKKWFEVWDKAKDDEAYWLYFSKQKNDEPEETKPATDKAADLDALDELDELDG